MQYNFLPIGNQPGADPRRDRDNQSLARCTSAGARSALQSGFPRVRPQGFYTPVRLSTATDTNADRVY